MRVFTTGARVVRFLYPKRDSELQSPRSPLCTQAVYRLPCHEHILGKYEATVNNIEREKIDSGVFGGYKPLISKFPNS